MYKAAIAALAAFAVAVLLVLPRLGVEPGAPAAAENPMPAPPRPAPGVPVTAGTVETADVPVVLSAIGTVQANATVTIKSRVDGHIVDIGFTEGQYVKAGAPLLRIDPRPYQAALEQARAAKEKDDAALSNAQADLARSAQLVGPGYRTVQVYDQQKMQVAQLQAALKADEAQINMAELNLGYTAIKAPIDGRLGAKLVDAGNLVRASEGTALVTIAQIKPILVNFTIAQKHLEAIREQQAKAPLAVQAFLGGSKQPAAEGKLTMIDNAIDQASGTIRLKATFANDNERLWPGQFVNVRLILNVRKGVPTVPAQTVQDGPTGVYAYVINSDDTVERRHVEVSMVQDGVAVVTKGLSPGERVVVEGQYRLTNGVRVKASAPAKDAAG